MARMKVSGPLTWFKAQTFLGNRGARTLGNNTTVHAVLDGDYMGFSVRLHGNEIMRIHADYTYTLKDGGWQTITTKDRLNALSPASVFQRKGTWYVGSATGQDVPFYSGIRVDQYGRVTERNER